MCLALAGLDAEPATGLFVSSRSTSVWQTQLLAIVFSRETRRLPAAARENELEPASGQCFGARSSTYPKQNSTEGIDLFFLVIGIMCLASRLPMLPSPRAH